jgi:hypothetical protein
LKTDKINQLNDDLDEILNLPRINNFSRYEKAKNSQTQYFSWGKGQKWKKMPSMEEILERWATFYEDVYDDPNKFDPLPTTGELTYSSNNKIRNCISYYE